MFAVNLDQLLVEEVDMNCIVWSDLMLHMNFSINLCIHYENLSFGRVYCRLINKVGSNTPNLSSLVWESCQNFLPTALPLSCLCQAPKVINPSVMITTAFLSIMVHKQLVYIYLRGEGGGGVGVGGVNGPLTKATGNWLTDRGGGEITLPKLGVFINCPNERFSSWEAWPPQSHLKPCPLQYDSSSRPCLRLISSSACGRDTQYEKPHIIRRLTRSIEKKVPNELPNVGIPTASMRESRLSAESRERAQYCTYVENEPLMWKNWWLWPRMSKVPGDRTSGNRVA